MTFSTKLLVYFTSRVKPVEISVSSIADGIALAGDIAFDNKIPVTLLCSFTFSPDDFKNKKEGHIIEKA